jgi:hypothetical protein
MYNIQDFIQYLKARKFRLSDNLNNQVGYSDKDGRTIIFQESDVIDLAAIDLITRRIDGLSATDFLSYLEKRKKTGLRKK